MEKFQPTFLDRFYQAPVQYLRGICTVDVLNPCWDARPTDVVGKHWGGGHACVACTKTAIESKGINP